MKNTFEHDTLEMPLAVNKKIAKSMELINSIDFSMIKMKLMDEEEGKGWSEQHCNQVENIYKRFLCMIYLNTEFSIVPTKEVDSFWHQHILDTRAYANDCQKIFGKFIHHFPYLGMRGEDDIKLLFDCFEETKKIYFNLFGEIYCQEATNCTKCSCRSTCGGGRCGQK
jgi:hypothetical protein